MIENENIEAMLESLNEYLQFMVSESIKRIKYDDTDYYKGKVTAFYQVRDFIKEKFKNV